MLIEQLFSYQKQKIHYVREFIGGMVNFMAIAYIIIVNPIIMYAGGKAFPIVPTITATILVIIVMTTIAAFTIKLPFVIAPGLGINALISYTIVVHDHTPPSVALGIIFWSSLLLLIFSLTSLRQKIIQAIPEILQIALTVGIGLFLMLIGFKNANLIISNPNTIMSINAINGQIALCFIGFILTVILFIKKKIYALILPIIVITILSFALNYTKLPQQFTATPDFSLFLSINFLDSFKLSILPAILSVFLVNFFDATASVVGLLSQIKYKNEHSKKFYFKRSLITDGVAGVASGLIGTSPGVIFLESSTGIQNGAKTGIASLTTALLCIPFLFLSPLIAIIPNEATAPILILVGILMIKDLQKINLQALEDMVAVTLTVVTMPLCFSITAGAVFGITSYTLLKLLLGKFNEISPGLIVIALCCSGWFLTNI